MSNNSRRPSLAQQRASRTDGAETRAHIIETAGRLFAAQGYGNTTSKSICEHANVNMAAINYHFGSRDGLYLAVLQEVHRHMMGLEFLTSLVDSDIAPQEKLARFLGEFVHHILDEDGWQTRLWTREMLEQSPLFATVIHDEALPKFNIISRIISEITGLPVDDLVLIRSSLSVVAPCLMLLIINRRQISSPLLTILDHSEEDLAAHLQTFALAGLAAVASANRHD